MLASVPFEQLANEVVIAGCATCTARLVQNAQHEGIELPLHPQMTDDYVVLEALLAAGQGVGVLPRLALTLHQRQDVTAIPLEPA